MIISAQFEKVSFAEFKKSWNQMNGEAYTDDALKAIYDKIEIPSRGTSGSAGYDIKSPIDIYIPFGKSKTIPTGLRCKIPDGWFLDLNPRSGHGFKYGIRLANTRGIIDSDYYNADNEGHIMVKLVNESDAVNYAHEPFIVEAGKGFCQGIFTTYGITKDDDTIANRTGGFGSTDIK